MAAALESVVVRIDGDASDLRRELDRTQRKTSQSTSKMARGFKRVSASVSAIAGPLKLVGAAATAGAAALGFLTNKALKSADATAKLSARLGVNAGFLQEMEFAASQTGVSVNTLEMALQRMGRRAATAASGSKELQKAFNDLGVSVFDTNGNLRTVEDLLPDIADGLAKVTDQNERLRLAQKIFDSEGVALVQTLQGGSAALKEMRDEAVRLGLVLEDELLANSEAANDELDKLGRVVSANTSRALLALAPTITSLTRTLTEGTVAAANFINQLFRLTNRTELQEVQSQIGGIDARIRLLKERLADTPKNSKAAELLGLPDPKETGEQIVELLNQRREFVEKLEELREQANVKAPTGTGNFTLTENEGGGLFAVDEKKSQKSLDRLIKASQRAADERVDIELNLAAQMNAIRDGTLERTQERLRELNSAGESFGRTLSQGLKAAVLDIDNAGDALKRMGERLADIILQAAVFGPLEREAGGFFSNLFQSSGSNIAATNDGTGGPVGGFFSQLFGSLFGGGRMIGGPVDTNRAFLVGEKGPELFVPPSNGRVVPGGMGGGPSVTVNQVFNLTAGVPQAVRTEVATLLPQIEARTVRAVADVVGRGGTASAAIRGSA